MRFDGHISICPKDHCALGPSDPAVAELGSYRLLQCIGGGGMGAVYRAVHRQIGRAVAIKVMRHELIAERRLVDRFFREARAANLVRHPHIVEVYDLVESERDIYFIMELLRGQDLHDAVYRPEGAPMTVKRAVPILQQIADGLHAAHARGIVHRDIKPENIFLTDKNGARDFATVFDFGVAKIDDHDARLTSDGSVLGTPEYMAPEQARGQGVDGRADIYSLGCLAYEMFSRQQVFRAATSEEVLAMHVTKTPTPLCQIAPLVPPALSEVVMHALAKSPKDRPPTGHAFAESLVRAAGERLSKGAAWDGGLTPAPRSASGGLVLRAADNRSRRWRALAVGAGAAVLLLGAAVVAKQDHARRAARASIGGAASHPAVPGVAETASATAAALITVVLESEPTGASVSASSGDWLGTTPYRMTMRPGDSRRVRVQKAGYQPVEKTVAAKTEAIVALQLEPLSGRSASVRRRGRDGGPEPERATDSLADTMNPFSK
jgi:serine/threonine-protein kinase